MNLRLNVEKLKAHIPHCDVFQTVGKLRSVRDILTADLHASLGEECVIYSNNESVRAEVIGVQNGVSQLMTYHPTSGLAPDMDVIGLNRIVRVPVGFELLGRVVDGLGKTIDRGAGLHSRKFRETNHLAPSALERHRTTQPLVTGQRAIDGLLTIGLGQRIGLFAGSGVGKSTLLGEIAKHAEADMNVIALVGERGREVVPFLEDCLDAEGLTRSVVVVATADETPLMKVQAVRTAVTIAEEFRDRGANVLFFLDSLTRYANACRDLGLARGEVPGQRGYPPSVISTLATTCERLGNSDSGSITGILTVLVDGDDHNEPIADAARSILDGHIVLDRKLAAMGHYPAIDILRSLSRLFQDVTQADQQKLSGELRRVLATYEEVAELLQVGLYQAGTSPTVDVALSKLPQVNKFLQQKIGEFTSYPETLKQLQASLVNRVSSVAAVS